MTGSTADSTETTGIGPFTGRFGVAVAVVGFLSILIGIVGFVDGYMERGLLLTSESPLLEGVVLLTFAVGVGVVALFIAAYMEPGFGDDH